MSDTEYYGLEPWQRPGEKPSSPTAGMNIAQRILHVGGRNNAAGYVEFGSIQAVEALVRQVLRDLPSAEPEPEPVAWQWLDTANFRRKVPARSNAAYWRPLYTAPLTRRPLTPVQEAASELLEALCALVLNIDAGGPTLDAMRDARAAITKATGGNDE